MHSRHDRMAQGNKSMSNILELEIAKTDIRLPYPQWSKQVEETSSNFSLYITRNNVTYEAFNSKIRRDGFDVVSVILYKEKTQHE
jgi:hypothetical protein